MLKLIRPDYQDKSHCKEMPVRQGDTGDAVLVRMGGDKSGCIETSLRLQVLGSRQNIVEVWGNLGKRHVDFLLS